MFYRLHPKVALRSPLRPYQAQPGERILIVRSWEVFPPSHPTTRLCLDLMKGALEARPARRLLDLGCGSGILALAAAALGVPQVTGVDISMRAAQVTRQNARENGLSAAVCTVRGTAACLKGAFDLAVANLPWEVQLSEAPALDRLVAPQGRLILSGFWDNQEAPLMEIYRDLGWTPARRLVKDYAFPDLPPDISFTWVAWLLEKE